MTVASRSRAIRGDSLGFAARWQALQRGDRDDRDRHFRAGALRRRRSILVDNQHGDAGVSQLPPDLALGLAPIERDDGHGHARCGVNREHHPRAIGGQDADAARALASSIAQHRSRSGDRTAQIGKRPAAFGQTRARACQGGSAPRRRANWGSAAPANVDIRCRRSPLTRAAADTSRNRASAFRERRSCLRCPLRSCRRDVSHRPPAAGSPPDRPCRR